MGARRSQRTPQRQSPAKLDARGVAAASEVARLIAAGTATVALVAMELLPTLPRSILASPDDAANVAREAAQLALQGVPVFGKGTPGGEREREASLEGLLYRGFYAVNAARRIARAWLGGGSAQAKPRAARVARALSAERRYLRAHVEQNTRRVEGARGVDFARLLYGPVLGWYHLNPTLDPRPDHLDAHGENFRADVVRPPAKTRAWPGVLIYCGCVAGPPFASPPATLMLPASPGDLA